MRYFLTLALVAVLLAGAGCNATTRLNAAETTYFDYSDQQTGIAFAVPADIDMLRDGINGVEDIWKFTHDGDSYMISYNRYREGVTLDDAMEGKWDTTTNEVREVGNGITIVREKEYASTEAFYSDENGTWSIAVMKHDGTALHGERSAADVIFAQIVDSVTLHDEVVFPTQ